MMEHDGNLETISSLEGRWRVEISDLSSLPCRVAKRAGSQWSLSFASYQPLPNGCTSQILSTGPLGKNFGHKKCFVWTWHKPNLTVCHHHFPAILIQKWPRILRQTHFADSFDCWPSIPSTIPHQYPIKSLMSVKQ